MMMTQRCFDWDKAAKIIKDKGCTEADAGLREDWFWTAGTIFRDGQPVHDEYTYLSSYWATPVILIDDAMYECYKMEAETPGWDANTKWPESALKILRG